MTKDERAAYEAAARAFLEASSTYITLEEFIADVNAMVKPKEAPEAQQQ